MVAGPVAGLHYSGVDRRVHAVVLHRRRLLGLPGVVGWPAGFVCRDCGSVGAGGWVMDGGSARTAQR
jgi:hypothetical protein